MRTSALSGFSFETPERLVGTHHDIAVCQSEGSVGRFRHGICAQDAELGFGGEDEDVAGLVGGVDAVAGFGE